MRVLLLALLLAVDAPAPVSPLCPGDGTLADLRAALDAVDASPGDPEARGLVRDRIACLREVVAPEDARRVHLVDATLAFEDGATGRAWRSLVAGAGGEAPLWLPDALSARWAVASEASGRGSLVPPPPVAGAAAWVVDGAPALGRPAGQNALEQLTAADGAVLSTRLVLEDPAPEASPEPDAVLAKATRLLELGHYEDALQLAVPAVSQHPERAASFEAVAAIATDQLERARRGVYDVPKVDPRAPRIDNGDPRNGFLVGFDLGLPTGLRAEFKNNKRGVDGFGARIGANLLLAYGSPYLAGDFLLYADFRMARSWQFELAAGVATYEAYPLGALGVAVQFDPPTPLQAQLGARVTIYGFEPDVGLAFLW